MANKLFLDASYAIALSAAADQHHAHALRLAERIEAEDLKLLTTRAVVLEIGNALSKSRYRQAAVHLLHAIEADPRIEIIPISEPLYHTAFQLYSQRHDKEWGITDCLSFVVMQQHNLTDALTTDLHFQQAGFRALLRVT
jgi:predicted nucleic acid-binding protein